MIERRHEATSRKVTCPNGCGLRVYVGHLERHLTACTRTDRERRELEADRQARRRWAS